MVGIFTSLITVILAGLTFFTNSTELGIATFAVYLAFKAGYVMFFRNSNSSKKRSYRFSIWVADTAEVLLLALGVFTGAFWAFGVFASINGFFFLVGLIPVVVSLFAIRYGSFVERQKAEEFFDLLKTF